MNCYTHNENPAIGICKACGRGVCMSCPNVSATATDLSCSDACAERVKAYDEINEKAELLYGIGRHKNNQPKIPTMTAIMFIFSLLMLAMALVISDNFLDLAALPLYISAIGFFLVGIFSWYRYRKKGINF